MIKEMIQAYLTIVHVFHAMPLWAIHGWHVHYPGIHQCRYGRIASVLVTIQATKFIRHHKSCMCQYIIKLVHQGQVTWSLIDSRGGYHLRSSEHENTPLTALLNQYSPLSPNCLT
jgi:hypothetical protein